MSLGALRNDAGEENSATGLRVYGGGGAAIHGYRGLHTLAAHHLRSNSKQDH
jgi:hypothetical protein